MPVIQFEDKASAETYLTKNQYKRDKASFLNKAFSDLLEAARIEKEGVSYKTKEYVPPQTVSQSYSSSSHGEDDAPSEAGGGYRSIENNLYKGSDSRYREICDLIAVKLIYCFDEDCKNFTKGFTSLTNPELDPIKKDVYKILKDKYRKSVEDLSELSKHYPEEKNREKFVEPLGLALNAGTTASAIEHTASSHSKVKGNDALNRLRAYAEKLLDPDNDISMAQQLKNTGDPLIVKVLKGMLLTLGTGTAYAWYALKQAVTGEASYKWIDNPAERLAKNAESRLFPHYQSLQHSRTNALDPEKTAVRENQANASIDRGPRSGPVNPS